MHDYIAKFRANTIYKFADNITTVGRISNNDELEYGKEMEGLVTWKFNMSIRTFTNIYRCTIESTLSNCITACYGNCSAQKRQKLVCTAQTITKANLPSMDPIYTSYCHGKAANIIKDSSHPG
eukprot:g35361.t1